LQYGIKIEYSADCQEFSSSAAADNAKQRYLLPTLRRGLNQSFVKTVSGRKYFRRRTATRNYRLDEQNVNAIKNGARDLIDLSPLAVSHPQPNIVSVRERQIQSLRH
jgi:hypothetical protein